MSQQQRIGDFDDINVSAWNSEGSHTWQQGAHAINDVCVIGRACILERVNHASTITDSVESGRFTEYYDTFYSRCLTLGLSDNVCMQLIELLEHRRRCGA